MMDEKQIPQVRVGIMNEPMLDVVFNGEYRVGGAACTGEHHMTCADGQVLWNGQRYGELLFEPVDADAASFTLKAVTIGVSFHWKRQEDQTFKGALHIIVENDKLTPVNVLSVEDYLLSVISSEMSANASLELLKAHAVISRSWLLAQIHTEETVHRAERRPDEPGEMMDTPDEQVKWWDRDDHVNFDVCADDHCQRYQGITMATNRHVEEAVRQTRGQILTSDGEICDARFGKCCGGVTEEFQYCWENSPKSYLKSVSDTAAAAVVPDLTVEAAARKWILSEPEAFCNTHDKKILSQVLNDYDQETRDFYRWHVDYTQSELAGIIDEKLNMDFGDIVDLIPLDRGRSGRIWRLKIVGTKRTFIIGKELEIRRALSKSHLYSSAFVVDRQEIVDGVPQRFRIDGAGWGHGVGLCQIGAAVMGEQGYKYDQILLHYYSGAEIEKIYK